MVNIYKQNDCSRKKPYLNFWSKRLVQIAACHYAMSKNYYESLSEGLQTFRTPPSSTLKQTLITISEELQSRAKKH